MSDVSWWLMLLSFVLGAVITWFWVVRRATRQVAHVVRRERHVATAAPVGRVHHDVGADRDNHGAAPAGWVIKGHRDSRRFHTEDSPEYRDTRAEEWFEDEESARRAGYTRWDERQR